MEVSESTSILIDPTDIDPREYVGVKAVIVTHEHPNHFDLNIVKSIHEESKCVVISDVYSYEVLKKFVNKPYLRSVKPGDKLYLRDLSLFFEKSNHRAFNPVTVLMDLPSGVKVYHTSDSLPFKEASNLAKKYGSIDLVFCTVGFAPHSSPKKGAELAKLVKPRVAVPYHGSKLKEFCQYLRNTDIKCFIMDVGVKYSDKDLNLTVRG